MNLNTGRMAMRGLLGLLVCFTCSSYAGLDFGVSAGQAADARSMCRTLNREVARNWTMLRDHMAPNYEDRQEEVVDKEGKKKKKRKRPSTRDFECVSPYYMRDLFEMSGRGSFNLRCFNRREPDTGGFCCDKDMTVCTMYSPR